MEKVKTSLIIGLCFLSGYLYLTGKQKVELLQNRTSSLEEKVAAQAQECEGRIALAKSQLILSAAPGASALGGKSIPEIIRHLPNSADKVEEETLKEMKVALNLSAEQEKQIPVILDGFDKSRKKVFEKAKEENRFILDPKVLSGVNEARREALTKLKKLLNEDQYKSMVEREYDLKLGLRVMRAKS